MSITSAFAHYASEWRAARDEARTRRALNALPTEILKDIGWPDTDPRRAKPAIGFGSWVGGR